MCHDFKYFQSYLGFSPFPLYISSRPKKLLEAHLPHSHCCLLSLFHRISCWHFSSHLAPMKSISTPHGKMGYRILSASLQSHHPPPSPGRILQFPSPCGPCIVSLGTVPLDLGNLPACVSGILKATWRYIWISPEHTVFGMSKHQMCCHSSVPQSSFSIILLTNNHFKDATSDSPWFIRILLSRIPDFASLGWATVLTASLSSNSCAPSLLSSWHTPRQGLPQMGWVPPTDFHSTPYRPDCNQFPYWHVSLPASSTWHKPPSTVCGSGIKEWVFTLWEHNCWHLMSISEVPGNVLTASLCIEVVNYGNKPWHC